MEITREEQKRMRFEFYTILWEINEKSGRCGDESTVTYLLDQYGKEVEQDIKRADGRQGSEVNETTDATQQTARFVPWPRYFDTIFKAHLATGHGGRYAMFEELRKTADIPIYVIDLLPIVCRICNPKPVQNPSP